MGYFLSSYSLSRRGLLRSGLETAFASHCKRDSEDAGDCDLGAISPYPDPDLVV
jgi:hypothetical protein